MKVPTIYDYYEVIKQLPLKKKYDKQDLLIPELCIRQEGNLEIYYAAHNEFINPKAKLFIVGITPGFTQMSTSIAAARACIEAQRPIEEIPYECKKAARLSGIIRKHVISMLDELGVAEVLGIDDTGSLFGERDDLLHSTAIIPFAAFVKGKNYTGHQPPLLKTPLFATYVEACFYPQLQQAKDALVVPLGKSVEEVLREAVRRGYIAEERCLWGFPHPSGANVNRKKQFEAEKEQMKEKVASARSHKGEQEYGSI